MLRGATDATASALRLHNMTVFIALLEARRRRGDMMLHRLHDVEQLTIHATNGELGSVDDFLFDDARWTIRYLVVSTGSLFGRKVAISPIAVVEADWTTRHLKLRVSVDQIREGPDLLAAPTIPRDREREYASYFGYPAYWGGPALWAWAGAPGALAGPPPAEYALADLPGDPSINVQHQYHLRSVADLRGTHLQARDGEIGHLDDLVIDGESWNARYLLADTSNWIGGKSVLIPTANVSTVDWIGRHVNVDLTRERIQHAPGYDPARPFDVGSEEALAAYYKPSSAAEQRRRAGAKSTP